MLVCVFESVMFRLCRNRSFVMVEKVPDAVGNSEGTRKATSKEKVLPRESPGSASWYPEISDLGHWRPGKCIREDAYLPTWVFMGMEELNETPP